MDFTTGEVSPKISVVTVCWNSRNVIEETLQSVISQSYEPIEYLVIDGGSTDGTLDVIRARESALSTWISEADKGISDAFNKGIRRTSGDLVGLLNAGDAYQPRTLTRVAHAFRQDPDSDVFYGDIYMTDATGDPEYVRKAQKSLDASAFRYGMPAIPHPSVFARRPLYEERLYDPRIEYAMDYEWLRDMAVRGCQFRYIEGPCLARMRLEGKSNDQYAETLKEVHRICVKYGDLPALSFLYNRVFRNIRFRLRSMAETTKAGQFFVGAYRRLITLLGLRRWEY
jgi:glycosyltransferase involved in cell wall biosynthesis